MNYNDRLVGSRNEPIIVNYVKFLIENNGISDAITKNGTLKQINFKIYLKNDNIIPVKWLRLETISTFGNIDKRIITGHTIQDGNSKISQSHVVDKYFYIYKNYFLIEENIGQGEVHDYMYHTTLNQLPGKYLGTKIYSISGELENGVKFNKQVEKELQFNENGVATITKTNTNVNMSIISFIINVLFIIAVIFIISLLFKK